MVPKVLDQDKEVQVVGGKRKGEMYGHKDLLGFTGVNTVCTRH